MTLNQDLAELRSRAEKFIAAQERLIELNMGIGGLANHDKEKMIDWDVWHEASNHQHADTLLAVISLAEALDQELKAERVLTMAAATIIGKAREATKDNEAAPGMSQDYADGYAHALARIAAILDGEA